MANLEIYIIGENKYSLFLCELAYSCGFIVKPFNKNLSAQSVSGKLFLLSIINNKERAKLSNRILELGGFIPNLIHPTSVIYPSAVLDSSGIYIGAYTNIHDNVFIKEGNIILSGVNIFKSCIISKFCFLSEGSTIGADTLLESFVTMGSGSISITNSCSVVGEGSHISSKKWLIRNIPANSKI